MTPQKLQELLRLGETLDVEFKSEAKGAISNDELLDAVVCMANRNSNTSGWIILGVEDNGQVTGARLREETWTDQVDKMRIFITNHTQPPVLCNVDFVLLDQKTVIVIEVPPERAPVGTTSGKYLRRALGGDGKPACIPFHYHEMQSLQAYRGLLDYTNLVIPEASWDDLDPSEFERYRRFVQQSQGRGDKVLADLSDQELAKALGAVEANHTVRNIRILALLLFGKETSLRRFLPTHEVAFQVLTGVEVQNNEFFRLPLLRLMEELLARFRARNREEELMDGLLRVALPEYSERAFREGVANALMHRDYSQLGAVHIQWFEDRIEISSPGGFPEGVSLQNLRVTPPHPRNPLLADAFKRAGLVERTARGIDTIFLEQLQNGRPAPSYECSTSTNVVLVLYGGKANLEFVRILSEQQRFKRPLKLYALLILNRLWYVRQMTVNEAAELIQKPEIETRAILQSLVEDGLVEPHGAKKGRTYHLSAEIYRRLGQPIGYVRQRGFETLQHEALVLQFVQAHQRISRQEVMALCKLNEDQASRLLRRLVDAGKLTLHQADRSFYYTMAGLSNN